MSVNVNTTTNTIVVQNANQTITVVDNENANIVNVTQPLVNVIEVASPGPQGPVGPTGPQGPSVPFTNIGNDVYATTSSLQVTGSFLVSGSSTFTNIGPAIFSGSTAVSGSLTVNGYDVVTVNQTSSMSVATASYLNTLNQDLTFNGNLTLNGTASISTLVVNETVLSTGSNQLGDNADDTQTLYGSVIVPTGSLVVTGSFTNLLSPTNLQIQSNVSSSFNSPPIYVGGAGWVPLTLSGSISSFLANKTNGYTLNGLVNGSVGIPAFGVNFPIDGIIQVLSTGSDALNSYSQFTDTTALGSAPQLSSGLSSTFFGSDGYNLYRFQLYKNITTNSQSLDVEKINNAGERVSLNLNNGTDGFSIFSTLSQPTSSFLKLVSGSNSNLIDFRYDANYIQQNTIIGSTDSPSARLQVKGSGTTNNTLGLNITNNNGTSGLFVQDDGKVGINRIPNSFLGLAWWNLHVSGTIASNEYVVGSKISVNSDMNPVLGGYPMVMNFTSSQAGYANVDFRLESDPNLSFIAPITGQTPVFTVKYDGKVGIGANNTNPSYLLDVSGSGRFTDGLTITGSVTISGSNTFTNIGPAIFSGSVDIPTGSLTVSGNVSFGTSSAGFFWDNTNSRLGIGTATPAYRLDVSGSVRFSDALNFTNSSQLLPQGTTAADRRLLIRGGEGGAVGSTSLITLTTNGNITSTSGNPVLVNILRDFTPTSGTATYTLASITGVINQTGGANGITRGLYINPTLTSAANFRAIETTSGSVIFNHGATPLMFISSSGNVGIGTLPSTNQILTVGSSSAQSSTFNSILYVSPSSYLVSRYIYSGTGRNIFPNSIETTAIVAGTTTANAVGVLHARGAGATSATTTFLLQNSTPTNLLSVLDNGQVSFTSPTMSLAASQSAFSISPIISASNVVGGQYYGVSITPTFFQTTGSQTETAFRVAATFTSSNATATSGSNIIADFGSTSAGSQLTVTDVTSGSIYMVNDVSGIPIIEATSNWDVNIYDFPNKIFEKTGSQVNIYGTMRVSGSFILPLSQSVAPQTGSAYWSGSLLFIYDGTRYRSSSFA